MRVMQQSTTQPTPATATREQIREQVRQTVQDANQAARDAVQAARDASQAAHDANNNFPAIPPVPPVPPIPAIPATPQFGGFYTGQNDNPGADGIPPQVVDISIAFFIVCAVMVIGWPISRALGRRIESRGTRPGLGAGSAEQLQRIEQAVDAMSIEIERISESQRFMARLQGSNPPVADALGMKISP